MPLGVAVTVLAKGFDLRSGTVKVTVPSNIPADEYSITREPEQFIRMSP